MFDKATLKTIGTVRDLRLSLAQIELAKKKQIEKELENLKNERIKQARELAMAQRTESHQVWHEKDYPVLGNLHAKHDAAMEKATNLIVDTVTELAVAKDDVNTAKDWVVVMERGKEKFFELKKIQKKINAAKSDLKETAKADEMVPHAARK